MWDGNEYSETRVGSERGFALTFCSVFGIVAFWPLTGGGDVRLWALALAGAFLIIGVLKPDWLRPLNTLWFGLGLFLGKIVTPVVLAILFFGAVLPTGLALRLFRKDPLSRAFDTDAASYWIDRTPDDALRSMKDQF